MKVEELLSNYDKEKVSIFTAYLKQLSTETDKDGNLKNYWFKNVKNEEFANAFKKVDSQGLIFDGESITFGWLKKLVITYDYHAYKNKVKQTYPESTFDFGVVYEGDKFSFKKNSGIVVYTHELGNPFELKRKIIGAYGVIRNNSGEFLETLNMDDIEKMKNSSKMKYIWNTWMDRMVLKSVIKRICSTNFHDITKSMDKVDNEVIEPENALITDDIFDLVYDAKSYEDLARVHDENIDKVPDKKAFLNMLSERKIEVTEEFYTKK